MRLDKPIVVEFNEPTGTEWIVSFAGPNPDEDKCFRAFSAADAFRAVELIDASQTERGE
jgi:hypothetical protein